MSPSGSDRWPVVVPFGTARPERGDVSIGAQFNAPDGDGGAVWAGGVTEPGGAWASATPEAAINRHDSNNARFIPMWENGLWLK
jgi:hypothetical protein